ncbi:preprotein translocase subunit SecG [Hoeflea poritis]|uniref:Protein-export membrane protein SecG n=1 Tax=Hoeflea poritis TaxID=2993659 RepID=A0ABT4VU25_9HYPH|nr:preprotein translocase subunit SecG [Hoeflea poritis]MDA4847695.1 preprotein translocase subunit SecG [Hoeflea poritis]
MQTVLIVIHLMIVVALVGVVLLQRSEGGALGIGGGSGGLMSARGAADALTRTTGILAAAFFATSIALGIYARYESSPTDILDRIEQTSPSGGQSVLDQIGGSPASSDDSGSADIPQPATSGEGDTQVPTSQ